MSEKTKGNKPKGYKGPVVGSANRFPFRTSVALWIDLLGYGSMISQAGFNPLHPAAKEALARVRRFHALVAEHSHRNFPTLVMNDGAVAYDDLSMRSSSKTYDFLFRAWNLYEAIRADEERNGLPGPRAVLACGFRMLGRRAGLDASTGHLASILERYEGKQITADEALREAAVMRPRFDIIPQLQANFAFTKAYVAESSGTAGGLPGARIYLDTSLLANEKPDWLKLGEEVHWRSNSHNLEAKFAPIESMISRHKPGSTNSGLRDGLQVAEHLAGDTNVLAALRAARKP